MLDKLDLIDRRILFELDSNSRIPISQLAKKLKVNRNVANFRINRLLKKGTIRNFVTLIRPNALGFMPYKFYIKLQNLTKEKEHSINEFIKTLPLSCFYKTSGNWDYIIGVLVKDIKELNNIKNKIYFNLSSSMLKINVNSTVEVYQYRRTYFLKQKTIPKPSLWINDINTIKLDNRDIELIKILNSDSRMQVVEISKRLNMTAKTVLGKIKRLIKDQVIYDYRISVNLEKIGFKFFKCLVFLKNFDFEQVNKLKSYCSFNPNITHLVECIGDWDFEIAYEVESEEKFLKYIEDLRYNFRDIIKNIEVLKIDKEYSYSSLPYMNFS